eukprot:238993_1
MATDTLELPLISNNHYNSDLNSSSGHKTSDVSFVVKSEDVISAKHTKIHGHTNLFRYIILFIVALSYAIYGFIQLNEATTNPLVRSYQDTTSNYPIPSSLACVNIDYDSSGNKRTYFEFGCSFGYHDKNLLFLENIKDNTLDQDCILVLPLSNQTLNNSNP